MTRYRRLASIVWLALALLVGQQAAALHDLGHATEQLGQKQDGKPVPPNCNKHFACSQLGGAVGTSLPAAPAIVAADTPTLFFAERAFGAAPRLAFRSRAPPALL